MSITREGMVIRPGVIPVITRAEALSLEALRKEELDTKLTEDSRSVRQFLRYTLADERRTKCLVYQILEDWDNGFDINTLLEELAWENQKDVKEWIEWGE